MTPAQYDAFRETVRLSRLRFANDPATLARLDEIEHEANRMMESTR
jgi:hypothetical protein